MFTKHWIFKGDFFKLWSSTFFSQLGGILFFYSLIWWSLTIEGDMLTGGFIIGIGAVASLLMSPFSGWLSDRFHRGKVLAIADAILFLLFLLLYFSFSLQIFSQAWVVFICRILISVIIGSTDAAARSLIPETIEEEWLEKGIGFQESLIQLSQLLAPAAAGLIISFIGIGG
ncbi:MAG TPA: MFS transporter, partial [Bacillaceae bacterium]